jgi:hypothetical protein
MLQCFYIGCLLSISQAPASPPKTLQEFSAERFQTEHYLLTTLKSRSLWDDPSQEAKLLQHLKFARAVKAESLNPILVEHINYIPPSLQNRPLLPQDLSDFFPAKAALMDIGVSAVPHLLDLLKKTNPAEFDVAVDIRDRERFLASLKGGGLTSRSRLAVVCLIGIYDKGGEGRQLAKRRIELEIAQARGIERQALEKLLTRWFAPN